MRKRPAHFRSIARRGMATMLVLSAVALASVLGLAILTNSSLQGAIAQNQTYGEQSDTLAESGVNLAEYYLINPAKAPSLNGGGYYPGETGISFGTLMTGTVDLSVTQQSPPDHYLVVATAHNAKTSLVRTITKQVQTCNVPQKLALESAGSINIPSNVTVNGDVGSLKTLSVSHGGTINGNVYTVNSGTNNGTITGNTTLVTSSYFSIPTTATDYRTYYYYNGTSWVNGTATDLSGYTVLGLLGVIPLTLGPTTSNPAGIYYTTKSITVLGSVVINGTLMTIGQDLTFDGLNIIINAQSGFPGLIINGNLVDTLTGSLTVNGVTWLSGVMKSTGALNLFNLNFNGAVIFAGSSPSISNNMGNVTMTYNKASSSVTHLGTDNAISGVYWQQ
jgi:hypothetical protein